MYLKPRIALTLVEKLCAFGKHSFLSGLVLESPFSTFADAMERHWLTKVGMKKRKFECLH